ncbi:hypothetical protein Tco_0900187 [Tanacetum coccineum]
MRWQSFLCSNSGTPKSGPSTALKMTMPSTTKEKICKKNDVKARSLLLMALPNEHQLTFNQYVDAQSMFNRLQKLVSRLAILGVVTPPKDLNVKFLRSLPCEWDTHVASFWMNNPDCDTMGLILSNYDDDLKSGSKVEYGTTCMRARICYQRTRRKIIIVGKQLLLNQGSSSKAVKIEDAFEKAMCAIDGAGFDWSNMAEDEIQADMALMTFTDFEVSIDKSCSKSCLNNYEALKKHYDDLLVKLDDTGFKAATYKRCLSILEGQVVKYKESEVLFSEEIDLLKRSVGHKEYLMGLLKTELEKVKEENEGLEFKIAKVEETKKARENTDAPIIKDWVSDDEEEVEPIPKVEKKTAIPTATKKESVKPEKPIRRSVSCPKRMVPRAVLMKTGLKTINNARPVNTVRLLNLVLPFSTTRSFNAVRLSYTAHPKSTVHYARPRTYFQNQAQSTVQRPFYKRTTLTKRSYNQNVNTGRQNVNTVRAMGFNAVKPSACWVWRPIKPNGASLSNSQLNDKGFVDSGCSRHMSGNISHLSDFKDFDGGYVTFGGGANGGRITGKGNKLLQLKLNMWLLRVVVDSTICIIENPVQHSKTKHIEIRHHFIRDCNAKKLIQMAKIDTQRNVADLLTKGFDAGRFQYLVSSIGMLNP